MAFRKKKWKKRIAEYPGRRMLTPTTMENVYDVKRAEGVVDQDGDGFTSENMDDLEKRIEDGFSDVKPFYGAYENFPEIGDTDRTYIDNTVDPRLMYTWDAETQKYILTGGAGGADGGSVDIPVTLTTEGWLGYPTLAGMFWQKTVTVPQIRSGMTPIMFLGATNSDDVRYAFSLLTDYYTGYGEITFYTASLPEVDIPIVLKGIPAQELEYVDNTVVFLVEPSAFTLNSTTQRYEATIDVPGMTEGTGGVWDIVRSEAALTVAESQIALSITDVDRLDGAVKITCLEVPEQRYMMSIAGAYPDAEPGTVILAGMQDWFDRVEELEGKQKLYTTSVSYSQSNGNAVILYNGKAINNTINGYYFVVARGRTPQSDYCCAIVRTDGTEDSNIDIIKSGTTGNFKFSETTGNLLYKTTLMIKSVALMVVKII